MATGSQMISIIDNSFIKGAEAAFEALRTIHDMPPDERYFLFDGAGIPKIVHEQTPERVFDVLKNKEKLLAQRLHVGDVVTDENYHNVIVTWVSKDNIHFDGIYDDGPARGRTISNTTLQDLHAAKNENFEPQDVYCLQAEEFNWE